MKEETVNKFKVGDTVEIKIDPDQYCVHNFKNGAICRVLRVPPDNNPSSTYTLKGNYINKEGKPINNGIQVVPPRDIQKIKQPTKNPLPMGMLI
jgi:hypothetical protein